MGKADNWKSHSGKTIEFSNGKGSGTCEVRDECTGCEKGHIDMTLAAFLHVCTVEEGVCNIKWRIKGSDDGNLFQDTLINYTPPATILARNMRLAAIDSKALAQGLAEGNLNKDLTNELQVCIPDESKIGSDISNAIIAIKTNGMKGLTAAALDIGDALFTLISIVNGDCPDEIADSQVLVGKIASILDVLKDIRND